MKNTAMPKTILVVADSANVRTLVREYLDRRRLPRGDGQ